MVVKYALEKVLSFAIYITDYRMVETPLTLLTTQKHYSPLKIEMHTLSLQEKTPPHTYGCQVRHIFLFLYLNVAKESSVSA
jgi:hypothetical protein